MGWNVFCAQHSKSAVSFIFIFHWDFPLFCGTTIKSHGQRTIPIAITYMQPVCVCVLVCVLVFCTYKIVECARSCIYHIINIICFTLFLVYYCHCCCCCCLLLLCYPFLHWKQNYRIVKEQCQIYVSIHQTKLQSSYFISFFFFSLFLFLFFSLSPHILRAKTQIMVFRHLQMKTHTKNTKKKLMT